VIDARVSCRGVGHRAEFSRESKSKALDTPSFEVGDVIEPSIAERPSDQEPCVC
jgi:hypothetical protein